MKKIIIVFIFSIFFFSCDLKTFGPGEVSDKIMITDDQGNVIGGNLNNWQKLDSIWLFDILKPVYPNPTKNGRCTLYVHVMTTIRAKFEFNNRVTNEFYFSISGNPYSFVIDGNAHNFRNQLKHLKIYANDRLYTMGYIQFD